MEDDQNPPDLIANTGNNDTSSPWAGLLQSGLSIGGNALTAALTRQTPVSGPSLGLPSQPASPPAPSNVPSSGGGSTMWIIGGIVLAAIAWFALASRR